MTRGRARVGHLRRLDRLPPGLLADPQEQEANRAVLAQLPQPPEHGNGHVWAVWNALARLAVARKPLPDPVASVTGVIARGVTSHRQGCDWCTDCAYWWDWLDSPSDPDE
jgi:hypothetical protein